MITLLASCLLDNNCFVEKRKIHYNKGGGGNHNIPSLKKSLCFFRAKVEQRLREFDEPSFPELRRLNDQMTQVERAFIYSYGLPGRPFVRHVIFAPSLYDLYGSSSFPGVTDVLFKVEETEDWDEVERQISIAVHAILSAVDILSSY